MSEHQFVSVAMFDDVFESREDIEIDPAPIHFFIFMEHDFAPYDGFKHMHYWDFEC